MITVEPVLTERETHKVIWKGVLSWGQDYPANTNVALQQNSEDAAIREICRKLSQQIYQKIGERFLRCVMTLELLPIGRREGLLLG